MQLFGAELFTRNLVQQFLEPSKRAKESANHTSQQNTDQNQKSNNIVREFEFRRTYYCLKCADWTGTCCCRTGIAVESRYADLFACSLVNLSCKKVCQKWVAGKGCAQLYFPSVFILSQYQHTPNKYYFLY